MTEYLIYFNQQWVGDHDEEWFRGRGPLARAVVDEMKAAGVLRYAGGLEEELDLAFSADATSGELTFTDGPFAETKEYLGGLTIVEAPDDEAAREVGRQDRRGVRLAAGGPPVQAGLAGLQAAARAVASATALVRRLPWRRGASDGGRAALTPAPAGRRPPAPAEALHERLGEHLGEQVRARG